MKFVDKFDHTFALGVRDYLGNGTTPELSQKNGNLISVDIPTLIDQTKELRTDIVTNAAFSILHGAGHNAEVDGSINHNNAANSVLRWDGGRIGSAVTNNLYFNDKMQPVSAPYRLDNLNVALTNSVINGVHINEGYINQMKARFGMSMPQDNWVRNTIILQHMQTWYNFNTKYGR